MLHPSYTDLISVINSEVEKGEPPVVNSRYSIVLATARRTNQLISGSDPMIMTNSKKPLSIAINELYQSKIKILTEEERKIEEIRMKEELLAMEEETMEEIDETDNEDNNDADESTDANDTSEDEEIIGDHDAEDELDQEEYELAIEDDEAEHEPSEEEL